jgi:hypothetical protein
MEQARNAVFHVSEADSELEMYNDQGITMFENSIILDLPSFALQVKPA